MRNIKIGLFGFGVVGEGIYKVLSEKPQLGAEVKKVVIKHPDKERNAPAELFSIDPRDILDDYEIDLVVELIDDAEAAYEIVSTALNRGKAVVSANKNMIARHLETLIELSRKKEVSFLYEAAVCGSVPIIRNLEEYFDNDLLTYVRGIVNGSTNYILSKMYKDGIAYGEALEDARVNGYAESDPSLDVEGIDAACKLSIISLHAFGKKVGTEGILRKGISSLSPLDLQYAREKELVVKLIAQCSVDKSGELEELSVLPTFVPRNHALGLTENEYNAVLVGSTLADEQLFYGKGAGRYPTSSAVLSDISAFRYGYRYEYKKGCMDFKPVSNGLGKFYISFEKDLAVDLSIFDHIEESYVGKDRQYVIGTISHEKLRKSELLKDPRISVISCN